MAAESVDFPNICWLCDARLPAGVHICAACENEINEDIPPKDYDKEFEDDKPTGDRQQRHTEA